VFVGGGKSLGKEGAGAVNNLIEGDKIEKSEENDGREGNLEGNLADC